MLAPSIRVATVEEVDLYAGEMHAGQFRKNGDQYREHPRAGAQKLDHLGYDDSFQRIYLVHDVPESVETPSARERVFSHLSSIGMPDDEIDDVRMLTNTFVAPDMSRRQRHELY